MVRLGWLYAQEPAAKPADNKAAPAASEAAKPAAPKGSTSEGANAADELALEESKIADKYARLEQVMLKMADLEEGTNPRRAALASPGCRAIQGEAHQERAGIRRQAAQPEAAQAALDGQGEVQSDLKALLELLMSEDRGDASRASRPASRNTSKTWRR